LLAEFFTSHVVAAAKSSPRTPNRSSDLVNARMALMPATHPIRR
jgi:hypothetical protein